MSGLLDQLAMLSNGRELLGQGLAGGAADMTMMHPIWLQEYAEGMTQLQFADWLKQKQMQPPNNPVQPGQM